MTHRSRSRAAAVLTTCLAMAVGVVFGPASAPASADSVACHEYSVPVPALGPGTYMAGRLCSPAAGSGTVMVLVPGATYNSTYWDFPYDPSVYNFRQAMNASGYATMTVDRLGTGASSKPLSPAVTSEGQALAVHQVIQALRAGRVGGRAFAKVLLGGHSLGSTISIWEAATYHDVDGVLLTGVSHSVNTVGLALVLASFLPAPLDPGLAGRGLDAGYLTTEPGTRVSDFDAPDIPDPGVAATDEATKDVLSATEAPDALGAVLLPVSVSIDVPVLLADGQDDQLFCGSLTGGDDCSTAAALAAGEAPYFSSAAHLETYVLPGSGHDVNLAPDTQLYQQEVLRWMASWSF
ncbi:alpha/beta hydrolase [Catenulispora sp. NF23]|uniref:alpha/beta hydrolase n=1 Tax=Catenulispora pinistramenti TaxID=2705254 RepID=UPI001BACA382|nr:alpha/beta hydrolase [Catenulispora pinistramenti]MBS2536928.1 alpha/beta hydrolase [Catenulispora pinistramenti]